MEYCENCCTPLDGGGVCGACKKYKESEKGIGERIASEWDDFWRKNAGGMILYAFSGGKDSTAALFNLLQDARKYGTRVKVFTIETGFKGRRTAENIEACVKFFGLEDSFIKVDIRDRRFSGGPLDEIFGGRPVTISEAYVRLFERNILPCGKVCNYFLDTMYSELADQYEVPYILTGGDTPKYDGEKYSLYWRKKSGVTIVRTGAAYGITKRVGSKIIAENNIPWTDPQCGGYDTDCLVPGAVFYAKYRNIPDINSEFVLNSEPIIFDYVTERVRHGVIEKNDGIKMLSQIDMASEESYGEMVKLSREFRENAEPEYELNRCMNYITKGEETAVYVYYHLFMFRDISQKYFLNTVNAIENGIHSGFDVPEGFIKYLEEKKIIVKAGEQI